MDSRRNILVLGSYGRGNIGDDAFLLAVTELFPEHTIYINSADDRLIPVEVRAQVVTISTSSRRDLLKKIRIFFHVRTVVYGGGDVWVELYGNRFSRKPLYQMALLNLLARLAGKQVYYVSCGIGNLSGYSLWLARLSARQARHIIVREQRSAALLHLPNVEVAPDLTAVLPYYHQKAVTAHEHVFTIGISLLYFIPNPKRNFPLLIARVVALIQTLPKAQFRIVLLPFLISSTVPHDDVWALEQLRTLVPDRRIELYTPGSVAACVAELSKLDLLIGARLHANILATLCGTPALGIAYRPKVASFFTDNALDDYCISIEEIDSLPEKFWLMYNNYPKVVREFQQASRQNLKEGGYAYHAFTANFF